MMESCRGIGNPMMTQYPGTGFPGALPYGGSPPGGAPLSGPYPFGPDASGLSPLGQNFGASASASATAGASGANPYQDQQMQQMLMALLQMLVQLLSRLVGQQGGLGQAGAGAPGGAQGANFPGGNPGGAPGGAPAGAPAQDPNAQIPQYASPNKAQAGQMLEATAQKYGIPPNILKAIAWQESGWNSNAVGDGGKSFGMMQIYSSAHPDYNIAKGKSDPSYNIEYGAKLLRSLYDRYGSWEMAITRYNGSGPMAEAYRGKVLGLSQSQPWGAA
ncbi:MAG: lytic transglycosylase domain-containing protein [Armatimonadetes bacterium]|nr:lytic transglycosylase domain-containing protein [Armatimonadota bacterium]